MSTSTDPKGQQPATLCVHAGHQPGPQNKYLVTPLVHSSAFVLDDEAYALRAAGRSHEALVYTRETNPTLEALERKLAALEGSERALVFSSGMAAFHAILCAQLRPGARVVLGRELYGGSLALLRALAPHWQLELVRVDLANADATRAALLGGAALLCCESLSNPALSVADLPRLAQQARGAGARLVVDATFVTPLGQRPLELGADFVWHSATKYLGGHSDLIGGVVAGSEAALAPVRAWRTQAGGCMDPQAAWLLERGLKTLALRMQRHASNALVVAHFLAAHPRVERVHHPGLETHPTHAVAGRVLRQQSGMLACVLRGGDPAARALVRRTRLFAEAASLGGVESLISVPAQLSHVGLTPGELLEAGITPGMVRLSVGIEDDLDLLGDLAQAFDSLERDLPA